MQCRYRETVLVCGDYIHGEVHPTWRESGRRRGRFRETSEQMKRLNERRARIRLTAMIHANFRKGDYALHLTYTTDQLPETPEAFERDVRNLMARLRRLYAREGRELKYIVVRGWSGRGRPHLHILLSGGVDRDRIEEAWGKGFANADRLEFTETGLADLSTYISGQLVEGKADDGHVRAKGARRWSGSRNLVKPVERVNMARYSREAMEEIADAGAAQEIFARRYPGYWLAEFPDIRQNPVTHAWDMSFTLYRPDSENLAAYARRERRRSFERIKA